MQITHEAAIRRLLKHGWKRLDSKTPASALARCKCCGQGKPSEWLQGGALKAIVLHCL